MLAEIADRYGPLPEEAVLLGELMVDKAMVRALGALGYELAPSRARAVVRARQRRSLPPRSCGSCQDKGSRCKLTPDMRLAYTFDDREKTDRLAASRDRLQQLRGLVAA